jgi:type IV pilus assembly protein PilV
MSTTHRRQRGVTLLDALIAIVLLAFGLLGLVGLQARLLKAGTDAQYRIVAAALADRLLGMALVDAANVACYTLPANPPPTCGSVTAFNARAQWERDLDVLPAAAATVELTTVTGASASSIGTQKQLHVQIQWTSKEDGRTRSLEAYTDVR